MESEGQEDESLEGSNRAGLLTEPSVKTFKGQGSSKVTVPSRRPRKQLWLHSALMCGREFLYAVEVVLVTPILLQLGMPENLYSYIWFISPSFGLLFGPFAGNWSDKCTLRWGRRRPFILGFVLGTIAALTLMIFSRDLGVLFTDVPANQQTIGLVFGIIGSQAMDFCLDQLEVPLRAFTLDVCSSADQQRAFTLQTLSMGIGAFLGFVIDGIKWDEILGFEVRGLQIKVVYVFAMIIYISTAVMTLFSIKEAQYKKPARKKHGISKSLTALKRSHGTRENTRQIASEPCVISKEEKEKQKLNQSNNNEGIVISETKTCVTSKPEDSAECAVTSNRNMDGLNQTGEELEHGLDAQRYSNFLHVSPAIRSITVLPRISLCKSIFLTMSCPEGLNDVITSSSLATVLSTATDNDLPIEGNDDSAEWKVGQDEDTLGSSMPNLPVPDGPSRHPATFLEIIKNKMYGFSSNATDIQGSNVDSDVDPENCAMLNRDCAIIGENCAMLSESCTTPKLIKRNNLNAKPQNFPEIDSKLSQNQANGISSDDGCFDKLEEKKNGTRKEKRKGKSELNEDEVRPVSSRLLWLSIITMPVKLRFLCFSLLMSFIGIEVLLLWYTNIFGSVVYGGDPQAPPNSTELQLYNDGVHMGCWGLTIYAGAVMIFSIATERFNILTRASLRFVYAGGQLLTAISTAIMFVFTYEHVILMLSWTIGITTTTSVTIPYILVGKYHQEKEYVMMSAGATKRGYGTDCAILACQMYAGNLLYAAISGPVITAYGGVKIMLIVASICHTIAFLACVFLVTYPGERSFKFCSGRARTSHFTI